MLNQTERDVIIAQANKETFVLADEIEGWFDILREPETEKHDAYWEIWHDQDCCGSFSPIDGSIWTGADANFPSYEAALEFLEKTFDLKLEKV